MATRAIISASSSSLSIVHVDPDQQPFSSTGEIEIGIAYLFDIKLMSETLYNTLVCLFENRQCNVNREDVQETGGASLLDPAISAKNRFPTLRGVRHWRMCRERQQGPAICEFGLVHISRVQRMAGLTGCTAIGLNGKFGPGASSARWSETGPSLRAAVTPIHRTERTFITPAARGWIKPFLPFD
ncbi:MAG: hypothetical protein ABJN39_04460 [Sulfitobacter sp.]|uniref:hypothetical protein n=1 Tax=Alphaproteobacteria TaxID=28211 RepID=UPI00294360A0|nr:hypothetical protein [Sulfitobacter sp. LC.270.F.C4]WOI15253.1 hypothetical protein R1T45_19610 [Sulfitobacter sp. LC.270.F.C4]